MKYEILKKKQSHAHFFPIEVMYPYAYMTERLVFYFFLLMFESFLRNISSKIRRNKDQLGYKKMKDMVKVCGVQRFVTGPIIVFHELP